ncbi:RE1 [Symbiodinium sp. CCMP2592]|nr:RE1 [Symbiodinium sp. CCMP2592]
MRSRDGGPGQGEGDGELENRALTGAYAMYPSLSNAWSYELAMNTTAAFASRMRTFLWKKLLWQLRAKRAVEAEGDRRWKRSPRWLSHLFAKEIGAASPRRQGHEAVAAVRQASSRLMELFTVVSVLSACACERPGWRVLEWQSVARGRDLRQPGPAKDLVDFVRREKPVLLVMMPPSQLWSSWTRCRLEDSISFYGRLVARSWAFGVCAGNSGRPSHKPEHQPIRGTVTVDGKVLELSRLAIVWRAAWGQNVLEESENGWEKGASASGPWSLSHEHLRDELAKQSMTGERYDYILFRGRLAAAPPPSKHGGPLARHHGVCAMVRPPQAQPQVAYHKPKAFNERLSGDSFYIWDSVGKKFAVTHFIDGLTDYHIGDERFVLCGARGGARRRQVAHGHAERHGAMVKGLGLNGVAEMRRAAFSAFAAKNRTLNKGGVSPIMQAATGRNNMVPGSLMEQLASGRMRFRYNEAATTKEAVARAERIRIGALEAFHWLDASDALRRALAAKSRPPQMEGLREGAVVYLYEPPASRKGFGQADAGSCQLGWTWHCGVRGEGQACPAASLGAPTWTCEGLPAGEDPPCNTTEEMVSADYVNQALTEVTKELEGGQLKVEEAHPEPEDASRAKEADSTSSSSRARPPRTSASERSGKLLDDVPFALKRTIAERQQEATAGTMEPHALDFAKKQKLFESLANSFEPPTTLQEAELRKQMEDSYLHVKKVRKAILAKPKGRAGRTRGPRTQGRQAEQLTAALTQEPNQMMVTAEVDLPEAYFKPGELTAIINDTVSACMIAAEMDGVTEVTTGKAVDVYLDHNGIRGVPLGQVAGPQLTEAELKARWIFGGHKDPDAGLYPTSSPTASVLGHNLLNFVAVQKGWTVHYEDVSSAFLQGKDLPCTEKIFVKVPAGYPPEVLGANMRSDLVELTKAGFGLPESPRLWYLEYRDTIQGLGLRELVLVPGLFRFNEKGELKAMASIHVDDTRFAGDDSSEVIWTKLHEALKFGKLRKATEGWQKFCGRWERQCSKPWALGVVSEIHEYTYHQAVGVTIEIRKYTYHWAIGVVSEIRKVTYHWVIRLLEERINQAEVVDELTEGDRKLIGSIVGQLNWAARQSRYDLCYVASLVQQLAGRGRLDALRWLAQGVWRSQEDVVSRVPNLGCPLEDLLVLSVSDAAFGAMPGGGSQGGILIMLASPAVLEGKAPVCILEGTSNKIHRVVRCSMSAEVSSLATAFEHGDYVRAVFCELVDSRFDISRWKVCASKWKHILITDARTGYDALSAETLPSDRKIAIDVGVLRQGLLNEDDNNLVRWVPGSHMLCDGLTKWGHNKVLTDLMVNGQWSLIDTPEAQELRRLAAAKRAVWRKAQKQGQ